MSSRLEVADRWLTETGRWQLIREQHAGRLWALLEYLRRHASTLMAQDRAMSRGDSDAWLASRPLVRAIDAELAVRGQGAPGTALATLRSMAARRHGLRSSGRG